MACNTSGNGTIIWKNRRIMIPIKTIEDNSPRFLTEKIAKTNYNLLIFSRLVFVSWAPTYLTAMKGFSKEGSRWAYFLYEWAGIPGMLVSGYLSDKLFRGRRAPATILFMVFVILAILVYWFNPAGNLLIDNLALIAIGFLIYGPVMMIGLQAADMVPREATGGATGLTGLLGYLIGSAGAGAFMGLMVDLYGWDGGFVALVGACILAIIFLLLTLGDKKSQYTN